MTAVPDRHDDPHHQTGRPARAAAGVTTVSFRHMFTLGLVTAVFGVAVLVWPAATLRLVGIMIGVWLAAIGALRIVHAFRHGRDVHGLTDRLLSGGLGIVLVLGGAACISSAATGVTALAVILGLAWMLSGFAEILVGLFCRGSARIGLIALGVVSIGVGLLFVAWPDISSRSLVLLTGITALILGTGEVSFAWQQRRRLA